MALWWVNLGRRLAAQVENSSLWCPNRVVKKNGTLAPPTWHWSIIEHVKPGEFIVAAKAGKVVGLAIANALAIPNRPKPAGFPDGDRWHDVGWLLPVTFVLFDGARRRDEFISDLFLTPAARSPIRVDKKTGTKNGNEIYMAAVNDLDGEKLFTRISAALDRENPGCIERALERQGPAGAPSSKSQKATTRTAVVDARLGQGRFRRDLLSQFGNRCCATELDIPDLLIASHIYPWGLASDEERLDPYDGLLLSAGVDAAFDKGLITIDEEGRWIAATHFSDEQLVQAGLERIIGKPVRGIEERHQEFLARHRTRALSHANLGDGD